MGRFAIIQGDVLDVLPTLATQPFDACLCDPPYHLTNRGGGPRGKGTETPYARSRAGAGRGGFMGEEWDGGDVAFRPETWAAVMDLLRPGAPLLTFGGTRTFHRLACAVEDAGFERDDTIAWFHGEGFPKSHNVVKAIDKAGGESAPWEGYGTALKPAWEPVLLSSVPLAGTYARNALEHGVGALNVEACRIPAGDVDTYERNCSGTRGHAGTRGGGASRSLRPGGGEASPRGRWPANVVLDPAAAELLDAQSGELTSGANPTRRGSNKFANTYGDFRGTEECVAHRGADKGGASRFFYCAKADEAERWIGGVLCEHPTLKPIDLCTWLARLVLPPPRRDGEPRRLLVPFCGAGSEMIGALRAGWDEVIGIEKGERWAIDARRRVASDAPLLNQPLASTCTGSVLGSAAVFPDPL